VSERKNYQVTVVRYSKEEIMSRLLHAETGLILPENTEITVTPLPDGVFEFTVRNAVGG
jgi:hypothetical protein